MAQLKDIEAHTKRMYDKYGKVYQQTRDEKKKERLYNEFLELPSMLAAVGDIRGKRLLDVGCGAGVHIKKYKARGALVKGMDISETMIAMARERVPDVEFTIGKATELPYKNNSFDVVTASLIMDYVEDLDKAFREVHRVLKRDGVFYYSDMDPVADAREMYEDSMIKCRAVGYVRFKKTGKKVPLGNYFQESVGEFEMVPGMHVRYYKRQFRTRLKAMIAAGLELVDYIPCTPNKTFKKYDPVEYGVLTKFPIFSIYVCAKK
jgi:ubiquinone/menaquinone biosynthesis C-methylase UbiE